MNDATTPRAEERTTASTLMRWCKFNLVGGIGIVVQFAALFLLKSVLHFNYLAATAIAVEFAVVHNSIWHERFTWADRTRIGPLQAPSVEQSVRKLDFGYRSAFSAAIGPFFSVGAFDSACNRAACNRAACKRAACKPAACKRAACSDVEERRFSAASKSLKRNRALAPVVSAASFSARCEPRNPFSRIRAAQKRCATLSPHRSRLRQEQYHAISRRLLRFNLTNGAVSIIGNLVLMRLLVSLGQMNYLVANGIAIMLCSLVNFFVSEIWVFARE